MTEAINYLKRDPRHYQIAYLGSFLTYGILALGWDTDLARYALVISTCIVAQLIATYFTTKRYNSVKSGMITALSLCLMLKVNNPITLVLACALAISSKFLIRLKGKHIFNPANFGIIVTVLITGDAWISPGQWGSAVFWVFLFGITGMFILFKVGRIDTSMAFLITYLGLEFAWGSLYLGWPYDHFLHKLTSGTLLLFTFFMITDPKTTPNATKGRVLWAAIIGFMAFFLAHWLDEASELVGLADWYNSKSIYLYSAPIWALFLIAPLTALLDRVFIGERFKWLST